MSTRVFERTNSDDRLKGKSDSFDHDTSRKVECRTVEKAESPSLAGLTKGSIYGNGGVGKDWGLERAPLNIWERTVKRAFDLSVSFVFLCGLSPILAVVTIAIRLESPGPAFVKVWRRGFDGRGFAIYKFRTARGAGRPLALTRVGIVLRALGLDEAPQLFNVLIGQMSLVGPRPHTVDCDDEYGKLIDQYAFQIHIKPGITGWAQVNAFRKKTRGHDLMKARTKLNLWYINNWNIWLDLRIIGASVFVTLWGRSGINVLAKFFGL